MAKPTAEFDGHKPARVDIKISPLSPNSAAGGYVPQAVIDHVGGKLNVKYTNQKG
jgi:hypothetical protein